jgi:hypothetical protein
VGRHGLAIILAVAITGFAAIPARADENAAVGGGAQACKALVGTGFSGVLDAPTSLISANYIAASASLPAYCDVAGYVAPSEGF